MTFYEWSLTKRITYNSRGDFLQDMRHDKEAPSVMNTKDGWDVHLLGACDGAKEAFQKLWREYQRAMRSKP